MRAPPAFNRTADGRRSIRPAQSGYTCPLTGEQLPCPKCCPLNGKK